MLALRSPRNSSRPCDATPLRRSPRIAAAPTVTRYLPDGSVVKEEKSRRRVDVSADMTLQIAGYVERLAAITLARGQSAFVRAIFDLYRYVISNPLPLVRNVRLRGVLLVILRQAVQDIQHPMILTIAERFLDLTDDIKGRADYVAAPAAP
jgi:hypothetical protein